MGIVLDASALIILDELGLLESLLELDREVIVPRTALNEVRSTKVQQLADAGRFKVVNPDLRLIPIEIRPGLGTGESGVLAYCLEHIRWAVLDDLASRRAAGNLGLKCVGPARLLSYMAVRGATAGESLEGVLKRVKELGFWIDDRTISRVLREPPPTLD
jgi:predicted nucleic acid-binding protein